MSMTQGGQIPGQTGLTRRRLAIGDVQTWRSYGSCTPATKWTAEATYLQLGASRIEGWWWLSSRSPEMTPMTSFAAAGVRARPNSSLLWSWRHEDSSYVAYEVRRGQWTRWRGHWVAGATAAMSSGGGACGGARCSRCSGR